MNSFAKLSAPKIGIITQARIGSSRLPGKTLREIKGISMLEYHLVRLQASKYPVYVATTFETDAQKLISIANRLGIESTQGSLDDVLSRFYLCAKKHELDVVVRVTSDCPLIDGEMIAQSLKQYLDQPDWRNVYLSNTQVRLFPRGFDFEVLSFDLLREAYLNALSWPEREHVTPYVYQKSSARQIHFEDARLSGDKSEYRITVDTQEDFNLVEKLVCDFNAQNLNFERIIEVMDQNPTLSLMNQNVQQKTV